MLAAALVVVLAAGVLGPAAVAELEAVAAALELAEADGIAADQAAAEVLPTAQAGGGA
ncbi:MAG TPA: hypothetical protein VGZ32_14305 [Actinocrinis sp.]|uniref:hypothetical protein n=1 Tax=Actinocrinis sp. TaxID=1920516 RepID=UPI002DDD0A33|nr:hypothetical protein [Actinocrinis sp.]HEV3171518.1 hypothetical protein [Actinocrinis sp.]